jgi:hypothetical protein
MREYYEDDKNWQDGLQNWKMKLLLSPDNNNEVSEEKGVVNGVEHEYREANFIGSPKSLEGSNSENTLMTPEVEQVLEDR